MSAAPDTQLALLPIPAILRLKHEYEAYVRLAAQLPALIESSKRKYEASLMFAPEGFDPEQAEREHTGGEAPSAPQEVVTAPTPVHIAPEPPPALASDPRNVDDSSDKRTWIGSLSQLLSDSDRGISHKDALARLLAAGLPASAGQKGFYNAISRLEKRSQLVKHGGLLYAPSVLRAIEGRGESLPAVESRQRSGGSVALVLQVLREHPEGLDGNRLRVLAGSLPGAPASIAKHGQYIYNVLATLMGQGLVTKDNHGIYRAKEKE